MVVSKNIVSPTDLTALHARGVHFVLCRDKDEGDKKAKSALASGWQKTAAPIKEVLAHHRAGGLLGFIPGRVGLWVLDVDKTPDDVDDIVAVLKRLAWFHLSPSPPSGQTVDIFTSRKKTTAR